MDELKLLIELVGQLPTMTLWVLAGFWAYKVIVVGSIYGLIKFCVEKAYSYAIKPKTDFVQIEYKFRNAVMASPAVLDGFILEIVGLVNHSALDQEHVLWLRDAIAVKKAKEADISHLIKGD